METVYDPIEVEQICMKKGSSADAKDQKFDILIIAGNEQTEDGEISWNFDRYILNPFKLAQHTAKVASIEGLSNPDVAIISMSRMGGSYGRMSQIPRNRLLEGAYTGMLKCFMKEFHNVSVKTIDISENDKILNPCSVIINELQTDGETEIGYEDGNRYIFSTVEDKQITKSIINNDKLRLTKESVVVAIGGSRGIAFDILREVARSKPRIIIMGRTELKDEDPDLRNCSTAEEIKEVYVRRSLNDKANGKQPLSPGAINAKILYELGIKATKTNLEFLTKLGANIEYRAVDATDIESLKTAFTDIHKKYGKITGIVHAAGILKDQLIKNKEEDHFIEVLKTKLNPAIAICEMLNLEGLEFIILFSSVAGRYGNAGQVDYASANEILNRFGWHYKSSQPNLVVRSICWGPWESAGMASEEVKSKFRSQGIIPIQSKQGCDFFLRELTRLSDENVEVVAGTGPWIEYENRTFQFRSDLTSQLGKECLDVPYMKAGHYLGNEVVSDSIGAIYVDLGLGLNLVEYLNDHRIDERCVLPAAGALELISAFIKVGWPGWHVSKINDLRVLKGIMLNTNDEIVHIRIKGLASTHASAEELSISATVEDPATGRAYYKAYVLLRALLEEPLDSPTELFLEKRDIVLDNPYEKYLFHGPRFRLIENIYSIESTHIYAVVRSSAIHSFQLRQSPETVVFDIGLIDTVPQLAIVWAREIMGTTVLPTRFGSIQRFSEINPDQQYKVILMIRSTEPYKLNYDASIINMKGEVIIILTDMEGTCNKSLNRIGGTNA